MQRLRRRHEKERILPKRENISSRSSSMFMLVGHSLEYIEWVGGSGGWMNKTNL